MNIINLKVFSSAECYRYLALSLHCSTHRHTCSSRVWRCVRHAPSRPRPRV